MTDHPIAPPAAEPFEAELSIPAALAAPKGKRVKKASEPVTFTTATFPEEPSVPPAAASAVSHSEEPIMASTIDHVTETTAHSAADQAQAHFADFNARAKDAVEKGSKFFAELSGLTKGNVEALVESGRIAAAGVQTLVQDQAAFARTQFEAATAAARTLAAVKSPTEFVKVQGDYVRQHFDGLVAETSRSTEAVLKLAGEIVQPISNRVAVAVEKIKHAA